MQLLMTKCILSKSTRKEQIILRKRKTVRPAIARKRKRLFTYNNECSALGSGAKNDIC